MKFTSTALLALGFLSATTGAIELNVDDPASIKKGAKIVAAGLRKWYTGDKLGDTPGNLPDPYYWWEAGAMFNAFVDYWYYTGDDTYNAITKQAMIHQIGDFSAFMPPNQTKTLGNDDQAFWGMAAMSAAENKFPDPEGNTPSWLTLAQAVFNTQAARWDMTACGGGLKWQIFTFNNGYNYKNTISNGCFFNIAARLAKYTGNTTYSDWAEKTFEWEMNIGLISPDYHFFDGSDDRLNCSKVSHIQWTYNAGVHMAGAAALWNMTQSDKWRNHLTNIINSTDIFFSKDQADVMFDMTQSDKWRNHLTNIINSTDIFFSKDQADVMFEVACERNGKCDVDQRSFKAYLCRWMGWTMQVAPWTRDMIMPKLKVSAAAAAAQCNAGEDQTTCGLRWWKNGQNDGSFGVGEQMSALEVMQNLLVDEVPGPVSMKTGGTSKSDPSAGGNSKNTPIVFDDITTGDKAGAGILTTIVLVGILGGAWWMVS